MGRIENVEVFNDTAELLKSNVKLKESLKKATEKQKIIFETDVIENVNREKYADAAKVIVTPHRTLEAASFYKDEGLKVAVHNFASATNPGGGVTSGANAQEEGICRCTGLYFNLSDEKMMAGFYKPHREAKNPIHNDDIIFTPGVTVFKSDTSKPKLMPENDWYHVDVITCAAPNLRENPSNIYNIGDGDRRALIEDDALIKLHEKRIGRILDVAALEGADVVVLGAFGCGAFCNSPEVVAKASRNVIKKYLHAFKVIEFAIYCNPNRGSVNYDVFKKVIDGER